MVSGLAMSDGVLWGNDPWPGVLVVDSRGRVTIGQFTKLPADARQVVSSPGVFLSHGKNFGRELDLAPRTAIGIDRDGKVLTLLVVDGRRPEYSVGMTEAQFADELIHLGCWNGILLDGGGSSTMVFRGPTDQAAKLVSHPSDGHDLPLSLSVERPVACALGVMVKDDPTTQP
jgi:exopolysaccharide biosynthesis protein